MGSSAFLDTFLILYGLCSFAYLIRLSILPTISWAIKEELSGLKQYYSQENTNEIHTLRNDFKILREDVTSIKNQLNSLKTKETSMKYEAHSVKSRVYSIEDQLSIMKDVLDSMKNEGIIIPNQKMTNNPEIEATRKEPPAEDIKAEETSPGIDQTSRDSHNIKK